MASGGFGRSRPFALRVPAGLDQEILRGDVGSMFPKVASVRQFRLNSSLDVSGPTGRTGAPRSFCVGRCRGMRRGGEQQQHN